jgi:hypothetical protein
MSTELKTTPPMFFIGSNETGHFWTTDPEDQFQDEYAGIRVVLQHRTYPNTRNRYMQFLRDIRDYHHTAVPEIPVGSPTHDESGKAIYWVRLRLTDAPAPVVVVTDTGASVLSGKDAELKVLGPNTSKIDACFSEFEKLAGRDVEAGTPILLRVEGMDESAGDAIAIENVTLNKLPRVIPRDQTSFLEISVIDKEHSTDSFIREHGSLGGIQGDKQSVPNIQSIQKKKHKGLQIKHANITDNPRGLTRAFGAAPKAGLSRTEGNRIRVMRALLEQTHTCDELEQMLSLPHQTCSAVLRGLSRQGFIYQYGRHRVTRAGGWAGVWSVPTRVVETKTHVDNHNKKILTYVCTGKEESVEYTIPLAHAGAGEENSEGEVEIAVTHIPVRATKAPPVITVPADQLPDEKLWYRAEIEAGTEKAPETRVTIRMLYRGAIADVTPMVNVVTGTEYGVRSERDYVPGYGATITAGGHVTNITPDPELQELLEACIDFISESQLPSKHPHVPVLEITTTQHGPNLRLQPPVVTAYVYGYGETGNFIADDEEDADDFVFGDEFAYGWFLLPQNVGRCIDNEISGLTSQYHLIPGDFRSNGFTADFIDRDAEGCVSHSIRVREIMHSTSPFC